MKFLTLPIFILLVPIGLFAQSAFIRVNQAGYQPTDIKVAVIMSEKPIPDDVVLKDAATRAIVRLPLVNGVTPARDTWGSPIPFIAKFDFSDLRKPGRYFVQLGPMGERSPEFPVGAYPSYH